MAKASNNPVHQHFVPKSYLKNFAEEKKGKLFFVDTIMRGPNEEIKNLPTRDICAEKNLYTFPDDGKGDRFALEKFYAKHVDEVYPKVYEILTNANYSTITTETKKEILNTLLSLYFRSPAFLTPRIKEVESLFTRIRDRVTNPNQKINIAFRGEEPIIIERKDLDTELLKRKKTIHEQWLIQHFGEWQDFVKYKMDCGMDVITVPDDIPLITSDNPVLLFDLQGNLNTEIFSPTNMIEIPLNRLTYLIIHPNITGDRTYHRLHRNNRDKMFAGVLNRQTEENSSLRILSYPADLARHFQIQPMLDEWSPENTTAFKQQVQKTVIMTELHEIIRKKGLVNAEVASKVKEIRATKLMEGEKVFESLIVELAKNGFFTA